MSAVQTQAHVRYVVVVLRSTPWLLPTVKPSVMVKVSLVSGGVVRVQAAGAGTGGPARPWHHTP